MTLRKLFPRLGFCAALILSGGSSLNAFATSVPLQMATATAQQSGFEASKSIDGSASTSWALNVGPEVVTDQTIVWEAQSDVVGASGSNLTFNLIQTTAAQHTFRHFRLSVTGSDRSTFANVGVVEGTATWIVLDPLILSNTDGATLTENGDNSISVSGTNPTNNTYTITATSTLTAITGFRLEAFGSVGNTVGRSGNGNIALTEFNVNAEAIPAPEPSGLILALTAMCALLKVRRKS